MAPQACLPNRQAHHDKARSSIRGDFSVALRNEVVVVFPAISMERNIEEWWRNLIKKKTLSPSPSSGWQRVLQNMKIKLRRTGA